MTEVLAPEAFISDLVARIQARRTFGGHPLWHAIADGKRVWAEPAPSGESGAGPILVFAWTDEGSGTIETVPGDVIVIR